ncbi:MAG: hypothetical protein SF182_05990 [Deltaproteobacteria bacterium]|nr:hypothetical protein [Deltaproteobacteria bacterium]
MTEEELRAFVASEARAQVEAKLAEMDEMDEGDLDALPARVRAKVEAARRECPSVDTQKQPMIDS